VSQHCYEARYHVCKLGDVTAAGLEHVPVDIARGIPHIVINFVGPPLYFPRHYRLPYYPWFIFRQQENGGMVQLAEWGKRDSLVASIEWRIAVV